MEIGRNMSFLFEKSDNFYVVLVIGLTSVIHHDDGMQTWYSVLGVALVFWEWHFLLDFFLSIYNFLLYDIFKRLISIKKN